MATDERSAASELGLRPIRMADRSTPADDGPYFVGYRDEWREFTDWEDAWTRHVMRGSTVGYSHIKVRDEAAA